MLWTIEEVVSRLGVTARTLHYYEEVQLLQPTTRSGGRHRLYDEEAIQRLEDILRLKETLGYSLAEIRSVVEAEDRLRVLRSSFAKDLPASEKRRIKGEVVGLLEDVLQQMDQKIKHLQLAKRHYEERLRKAKGIELED